jgi:hypothetical protein
MRCSFLVLVTLSLCVLGCGKPSGPKYQHERDGCQTTDGLMWQVTKTSRVVGHQPPEIGGGEIYEHTYKITYTYKVDGKEYSRTDTTTGPAADLSEEQLSDIRHDMLNDQTRRIKVYYNPGNPKQSHIFRRLTPEWAEYDSSWEWVKTPFLWVVAITVIICFVGWLFETLKSSFEQRRTVSMFRKTKDVAKRKAVEPSTPVSGETTQVPDPNGIRDLGTEADVAAFLLGRNPPRKPSKATEPPNHLSEEHPHKSQDST